MAKFTAEEKRLKVQNYGKTDAIQTYEYYKTRRFEVYAGTKVACVQWKLGAGAGNRTRIEQQRQATEAAVAAYEARWGPVDWWLAEVIAVHVTTSVLVELRVGNV